MHTDSDKRPRQRRRFRAIPSAAIAACLLVVALRERRRRARAAAPHVHDVAPLAGAPVEPAEAPVVAAWPTVEHAEPSIAPEPVWEDASPDASTGWPVDEAAPIDEDDVESWDPSPAVSAPWGVEQLGYAPFEPEAVVEHEASIEPADEPEAVVEVEPHEPVTATDDATPVEENDEHVPAPAPSHWFGSFAPAEPWAPSTPAVDEPTDAADADTDEHAAIVDAAVADDDSVIELPAEVEADTAPQDPGASPSTPPRLPPAHLRRFMGTGASVLVIALVLGAGVLVSGATADSTSDPATVPNAVGTVADVLPSADTTPVADTTTTDTTPVADTTTTDTTTVADTTTTGTTTTDTTTTDTTTTSTTPPTTTDTTTTPTTTTDTTTAPTTTTDTTATVTTDTTPPVVAPPVVTPPATPVAPATPAVAPAPAVTPPPTVPVTTTPQDSVPKPKTLHIETAPKKTAPKITHTTTHTTSETQQTDVPVPGGPPVVTLASGKDPIGSILSRSVAIPAVDAALLPTPAQVRFYVGAAKPLPKLPTLTRIDHAVAQRFVTVGRGSHVGWTVLAAVARLESNFGAKPGLFVGRRLATPPAGTGVEALATYLHSHHAGSNPLTPLKSKQALTAYFGSERKAARAIDLAALYGALGPFGMQHGVRAETARLQKRVLRDTRVHLTTAGRSDIRDGRVDPRVLVSLEYLANTFHKLGVSDLVSGGELFSRSGTVSAHLYGRAVDISSLHGVKVKGHQGPGTLTEQAIRRLLLLPSSLRPRQVISLMDVDGPTGNRGSFALPDHYNRIQIDY
jgi:hypothetical protein